MLVTRCASNPKPKFFLNVIFIHDMRAHGCLRNRRSKVQSQLKLDHQS